MSYQHDKLNQSLAAHQSPNCKALSPKHPAPPCCESSANYLAKESYGNDGDDVAPHEGGFAVKLTEKIEDLVTVLFLPLYFALSGLKTNIGLLDTGIVWANQPDQKTPENSMHTNDVGEEG